MVTPAAQTLSAVVMDVVRKRNAVSKVRLVSLVAPAAKASSAVPMDAARKSLSASASGEHVRTMDSAAVVCTAIK